MLYYRHDSNSTSRHPRDSSDPADRDQRITRTPENLEDLAALMLERSWPNEVTDQDGSWSVEMPTFDGDEPDDTSAVWSWDDSRLLVGTHADDLEIVDRETGAVLMHVYQGQMVPA